MVHRFPDSRRNQLGLSMTDAQTQNQFHHRCFLVVPDTVIDMLLKSMTFQSMHNITINLSFTPLLLLLLLLSSSSSSSLWHYYSPLQYLSLFQNCHPLSSVQFLTPVFFRSPLTDSSDPNLRFPIHRVLAGLRSVSFLQGSSSCILTIV